MSEAADDHQDALWRAYPKTRAEFEERYDTEEDCRTFLIECRWNGKPECARCGCKKLWPGRGGKLFDCSECGHQTSVTAGTLFHGAAYSERSLADRPHEPKVQTKAERKAADHLQLVHWAASLLK